MENDFIDDDEMSEQEINSYEVPYIRRVLDEYDNQDADFYPLALAMVDGSYVFGLGWSPNENILVMQNAIKLIRRVVNDEHTSMVTNFLNPYTDSSFIRVNMAHVVTMSEMDDMTYAEFYEPTLETLIEQKEEALARYAQINSQEDEEEDQEQASGQVLDFPNKKPTAH